MERFDRLDTTQKQQSRRRFLLGASGFSLSTLLSPLESFSQLQQLAVVVGIDLGKKLYDKIIDLVSANIFDLVGGNALRREFPEPTIADVKSWIHGAVIDLESRLDRLSSKIDQDNLARMQSDLDSIKYQFWEYVSLPPKLRNANRGLLINCDETSGRLLSLSQNYDQALFLSSVTLAHRLLSRFALFALDSESGEDASGHITSLVSTGEMRDYFHWATAARARLVDSLSPQYSINCTEERPIVGSPTTKCQLSRRGAVIWDTGLMLWPAKTDAQIHGASIQKCRDHLNVLMLLNRDVPRWRSVNRSSGEGIVQGAKCVQAMYYRACLQVCPKLFDEARLELKNTSSYSVGWNGNRAPGSPWNP